MLCSTRRVILAPLLTEGWPALVIAIFAYPTWLLVTSVVLAVCKKLDPEIGAWALRQAGRQRFTDLVRAFRK